MTVLIYVDTSKEVGDADLDRIHRAAVSLGPIRVEQVQCGIDFLY